MRRSLWALALTASLLVACGGQHATSAPSQTATAPAPIATPTGEPTEVPIAGLDTLAPTAATEEAQVVRVVDGDTIVVDRGRGDEKVRYIGIDTPETVKPASPVEWMGREASAANRTLVEGKTVVLEKDVSETDRYGRLLRHVWIRGDTWRLVNLELVREGYARVSTYPPDVKYANVYLAAQVDAREHDRGLWGQGPVNFLSPEDGATVSTKTIVVRGTARAGVRIVRDIANAPDQSTRSSSDGTWTLKVKLKKGKNTLRFRIEDEKDTTRVLSVLYAHDHTLQRDGSMLETSRIRALGLLLAVVLGGIGCSAAGEQPTPVPTPEVTAAPTPTPEPTPVPTPTPKPLAVKVTKLTKSAAPGDTASVTIKTTKGAACSITVTYESGDSEAKGLGNKKANAEGVVTWKWSVGLNTNPQTAGVWISCTVGARSGRTQADIVIK